MPADEESEAIVLEEPLERLPAEVVAPAAHRRLKPQDVLRRIRPHDRVGDSAVELADAARNPLDVRELPEVRADAAVDAEDVLIDERAERDDVEHGDERVVKCPRVAEFRELVEEAAC